MMNVPGYETLEYLDETPDHLIYRARVNKSPAHASDDTAIIKVLKLQNPLPADIARFNHAYSLIQKADIDGAARIFDIMVVPDDHGNTRLVTAEADIPGTPLATFMHFTPASRIPVDTFLVLAEKMARTIGQMHQKNLSHRSITTRNFIYDAPSGAITLCNFGIAGELTGSAKHLYDPWIIKNMLPYMSPEQTGRINRDVDYRADLYALGVVFYEMVTGSVPFIGHGPGDPGAAREPMEIVYSHIARQAEPPEALNPEIPPALSGIILKLLAKNPEDRYQNGFGLASDLRKCRDAMAHGEKHIEFPLGLQDVSLTFSMPRLLAGRQRQVRELAGAFENMAETGEMTVVFISGEPGIGKSALANEIEKSAIARRGFFLAGKYGQMGRHVPYSAIIQALQGLAEQILSQSPDSIKRWQEKIVLAIGNSGRIITDMIPLMEPVMGMQPDLPELGAEEAKNLFNDVFKRFISVFAALEHPLVLFLDDLHKADPASLDLIEKLAQDGDLDFFLLIGAWRDSGLAGNHPLRRTMAALSASSVCFTNIAVSSLGVEDVNALLTALFRCPPDRCTPLAEIIRAKTMGNPFFINQFIKTLYEDNLLRIDDSGTLHFELPAIMDLQVTDNVVDFMTKKLEKLPLDAREIIGAGACIGNRFDPEALADAVQKPVGDIFPLLDRVMQEGFLVSRQGHYGFIHDRIYEASYFLLSPEVRSGIHYRIGKRLLKNTPEEKRFKHLFAITDHLNMGRSMVNDPVEARQVARLNLQAAARARDTAAFSAAVDYLQAGIDMLPENAWTNDYDLSFSLFSQQMECRYITRDFEEAERLFSVVMANAASSVDKAKAATLMIVLNTNKRSFSEAIDLGVKALELFGINTTTDIGKRPVLIELVKAVWRLRKIKIDNIADMPQTDDPVRIALNNLLLAIATPAFYVSRNMFAFLVLKSANGLMKNGPSMHHEIAVIGFAAIIQNVLGDYDAAYRMGMAALEMNRKSDNRRFAGQLYHTFAFFIQHWKKHARHDIEIYGKAYQQSLDAGNLIYAGHSVNAATDCRLMIGHPLDDILTETRKHQKMMDHVKDPFIAARFRENIQMARCLMGKTTDPTRLDGNGFDEKSYTDLLRRENNIFGLCFTLLYKVMLFYLHGRLNEARAVAETLDRHIDAPIGTLLVPQHYFYYSLTLVAIARKCKGFEKRRLLAEIRKRQHRMKRWSALCPENFAHKHDLVEAELVAADTNPFKIRGDRLQHALKLYQASVKGARKHSYINEEALACERTALFYLDLGAHEEAGIYLKRARQCLVAWKADGLRKSLETRHPHFFTPLPEKKPMPAVSHNAVADQPGDGLMDLETVMKVSRTISSEIVLDRLLEKIMALSVTNAGAQKGFLILEVDNKRVVAAAMEADRNISSHIDKTVPLENCRELSAGIVNFVFRSREPVILADASARGPFKNDPYIVKNSCKSILCMPILNKGAISGVLYMENNLSANTFTKNRLELLNIIAAQAAISLENARLFELATIDGLTRLFVHRYFHMLLDQEIERSSRYGRPCSLLMIDIDNFKYFNDTYGHPLGDEVLRLIGKTLLLNTRSVDISARYGGEEFAVILPETDTEEALTVAEKIREAVERLKIHHNGHVLSITASIGSATFPDHGREKTDLIRLADEALYRSKKSGKNRVSTSTVKTIPEDMK